MITENLWVLQVTQASASQASSATSSRSELQALREEQARMKAEYDRMEVSNALGISQIMWLHADMTPDCRCFTDHRAI